MRKFTSALKTLMGWNLAAAAWAHPHQGVPHVHLIDNGLANGLLHPVLGFDHLLAMLAIGLIAAQMESRLKWIIPACFVGGLVLGGSLGMAGVAFGYAEAGIAVSLISLGCALAVGKPIQTALLLIAAATFGLMHGYAHGLEVPAMASPVLYAVGFTVATILLHVAGVAVGSLARRSATGKSSLRLTGVAVAIFGMCLLAGM